jgi:hypothetical protein
VAQHSFISAKFLEIIQMLQATPAERKSSENRRAKRTPCQIKLVIFPIINGDTAAAMDIELIDIAARGIGFRFPIDLTCGEQFILNLPVPGGTFVPVLCHTAYTRVDPATHQFRAGAEFVCVVNPNTDVKPDDESVRRLQNSILD